ncbi:MAG: hypothetical protein MMC23_003028 [Stictis urceolatum]|nr:hypothetical protein [Stictis urceolata]
MPRPKIEPAYVDAPIAEPERPSPSSSPQPSPNKKRKRTGPALIELEVDINAPEPPSKKARRLLKKGKKLFEKPKSSSPEPLELSAAEEDDENGGTALPNGSSQTKLSSGPKATSSKEKETRSEYGIWIGNLPFNATSTSLREFIQSNSGLKPCEITRVHLPPPTATALAAIRSRLKPTCKGFAYVDFTTAEAQAAAKALSETLLGGRRVLIKDAKNYEGRPDKSKAEEAAENKADGKVPGKRVFVGNLHFDTAQGDLQEHFEQCGTVETCFMATFEDTGKCKGYAWVTFSDVEAATQAVRGWVEKSQNDEDEEEETDDVEDQEIEGAKPRANKKPKKPRKWFVNRFHGRQLRVEFAEDPTTRYKKRYGKAPPAAEARGLVEVNQGEVSAEHSHKPEKPDQTERPAKKDRNAARGNDQRPRREERKVDARTIQPGAANTGAQRASAAIVESKGKKIKFD